jgi:hypothetical protein
MPMRPYCSTRQRIASVQCLLLKLRMFHELNFNASVMAIKASCAPKPILISRLTATCICYVIISIYLLLIDADPFGFFHPTKNLALTLTHVLPLRFSTRASLNCCPDLWTHYMIRTFDLQVKRSVSFV